MTARPLPVHKTASATILMTKGWPQRAIKQVRQDCAEAARQIEKGEATFDMTGAVLTAWRDFQHAKGLIPSQQSHLTSIRAVGDLLRGIEHEPPVNSPVYDAAKVLRATSLEAKAIDENAGLTDLSDTIEAVDATAQAMSHDLQTLISNVAPARKEFCRLLVAAIGTGKASLAIIGENVFDNDETRLKEFLPDDVLDELETEHDWTFVKGHWEFNANSKHNRRSSEILVEACKRSMAASIRNKRKSLAQTSIAKAAERDAELGRQAEIAAAKLREAAK